MTTRPKLLEASDEDILDAVRYAQPMVLRGLLYLLTGDDEVAATAVEPVSAGLFSSMTVTDRGSQIAAAIQVCRLPSQLSGSGCSGARNRPPPVAAQHLVDDR